MKTIKYFTLRLMAVAAIAIAFALPAKSTGNSVYLFQCRLAVQRSYQQ